MFDSSKSAGTGSGWLVLRHLDPRVIWEKEFSTGKNNPSKWVCGSRMVVVVVMID